MQILNITLPDSQGLETIKSIRAKTPEIPILVLTGCEDEETAIQAAQTGVQDYLSKGKISAPLLRRVLTYATRRQKLLVELEQRARQLALINEIGQKIAAVLKLDDLLDNAAYLVQTTFGYHHVALFLLDKDVARLKAIAGSYAGYFPLDHSQRLNQGIIGRVATGGEKVVANDIRVEPDYISWIANLSVTQSELCLPIKIGGQTVGILDIQSPQLNAFGSSGIQGVDKKKRARPSKSSHRRWNKVETFLMP